MTVKRSEFYRILSKDDTDLQSIDLQGSKQVILKFFTGIDGHTAALQDSLNPNETNYLLFEKGDNFIVCASNDGYLYFRSLGVWDSFLHVWVI